MVNGRELKMKLHRAESVLKLFSTGKIENVIYEYEYHDNSNFSRAYFRNVDTFAEIDGPVSLTHTYCNRKIKLKLEEEDSDGKFCDVEYMMFNDYGDEAFDPESEFYKKMFDYNGVGIPATIIIDQDCKLYIASIYKLKIDYGYTLDLQYFCDIPKAIYDKLWNCEINHKRPYSISIDNYTLTGFITNYIGFRDLHKSVEIRIRNSDNEYYVFTTEGYKHTELTRNDA
jgi:hypothetical protein